MKDYGTDRIRNVCLLGHGGAGKTSLGEAMLFNTGVLDRLGKVPDGNTTSDFDPEEIKRNISINTSLLPCEWQDFKMNILDTPGYFDFVGEVHEALRVSDAAVIVVSGKSGIAVGTEKAWEYLSERRIPRMIFINKMDEDNADFFKCVEAGVSIFGKGVVPFQVPIFENGKFTGFVDIIDRVARKCEKDKLVEIPIPGNLAEQIEAIHAQLDEVVAETDEELLNKFFAGEAFTHDEFHHGLRAGILAGSIAPVFCGSATGNGCIRPFMDALVEYMPGPEEETHEFADDGQGHEIEIHATLGDPLAALVFKTIADPFVGKISMFRVYEGMVKSNSTIYNATSGHQEKIGQVFLLRGKKQIPVDRVGAGDIGAVAKLQYTSTNDTLCDVGKTLSLHGIAFPKPCLSMAIEPMAKGDEEKISTGIHRLQDEDPTIRITVNTETHQTLLEGLGEQHLDVIVSKLKAKFQVGVKLISPKVPYRETIRKKVKVEGKHKKQSGGHGQYGHVWLEFEPGESEHLTFNEKIFGGSVPKQYHPAVEKGLQEAIVKGVLAGYPVVNLKATLVDGSYHDVDSSEMAFKIAARQAYKKGVAEASPVLLEPIGHAEINVPESYMGDVIGDMNKRRGRILGMNPSEHGMSQVVAEVPLSEMFRYAIDLRSMTQGRGSFSVAFERYEEAPPPVAQKVIEEARKHMVEEDE